MNIATYCICKPCYEKYEKFIVKRETNFQDYRCSRCEICSQATSWQTYDRGKYAIPISRLITVKIDSAYLKIDLSDDDLKVAAI